MMKLKSLIAGAVAGVLLVAGAPVQAEDWAPDGLLRLQIGFGAGGSTDTMGRVIAEVMQEQTGWNMIVENRPGGGGIAMFTGIAKSAPTGDTIGMGVNLPVLINLVMRGDAIPFTVDDFDYIGTVTRGQLGIMARADAPFDDIKGMIEYSKANNGLVIGFDSKPQEALMQYVNKVEDANFRFVSAESTAEVIKLMLGGQIMVGFSDGTQVKYLESGDFKMLAAATDSRHGYAPDTATVREQGWDIAIDPYFYIAAPKGLPAEAKAGLAAALDAAMQDERVVTIIQNAAQSEPLNLGPDGTAELMNKSLADTRTLFGD